jgi:hypothetical protein
MSRVPIACAVSHVVRGHDEPAEDEQGSLAAGRDLTAGVYDGKEVERC